MVNQAKQMERKYEAAISHSEEVHSHLELSSKKQKFAVEQAKKNILQQLEEVVDSTIKDIDRKVADKKETLENTRYQLQDKMSTLKGNYEQAIILARSESDFEITEEYPVFPVLLQTAIEEDPIWVTMDLSSIKVNRSNIEELNLAQIFHNELKAVMESEMKAEMQAASESEAQDDTVGPEAGGAGEIWDIDKKFTHLFHQPLFSILF